MRHDPFPTFRTFLTLRTSLSNTECPTNNRKDSCSATLWQPFSRAAISLGRAELTTLVLSSPKLCRYQLTAGPSRHTSSTRPTIGAAIAFQSNTFCFVFVVFGQQKPCARCSEPPSRTKSSAQTARARRTRVSVTILVSRCGLI